MCGVGGGGGGSGSEDARAAQARRENAIHDGMAGIDDAFKGYDDAYYKDYEGKYSAMARPDIDKQERNARQDVLFGLARAGQTKGSAAAKAYGDVADTRARTDLQVADQARTASAGLRNDVENARGNLVNQLNASADAGAAAASARNQATLLTRPPTYSPITNAFSEVTNQIAMNEQARRDGNPGWGWGLTGVSDPIKGSRGSITNIR